MDVGHTGFSANTLSDKRAIWEGEGTRDVEPRAQVPRRICSDRKEVPSSPNFCQHWVWPLTTVCLVFFFITVIPFVKCAFQPPKGCKSRKDMLTFAPYNLVA